MILKAMEILIMMYASINVYLDNSLIIQLICVSLCAQALLITLVIPQTEDVSSFVHKAYGLRQVAEDVLINAQVYNTLII